MKRITKGLPHPLSIADSLFMQKLLAGVRQKREQAVVPKPNKQTGLKQATESERAK